MGVFPEAQVEVGLELEIEIVTLFLMLNLALAVWTRSIREPFELELESLL